MGDFIRKQVSTKFRLNGLRLNSDAVNYIVGLLNPLPDGEQYVWLDKLIEAVQKQPLTTSLISKDVIVNAAKECGKGDLENQDELLTFINAFDVPRFKYDSDKKKFFPCPKQCSLFGDAVDKGAMLRDRYSLILQRTYHNKHFSIESQGVDRKDRVDDVEKYDLRPVEFLLGSSSKISDVVVLGMITQMVEGKYHLEDATGSVELDLSETKFNNGLFTENCFVLAEGYYDDKILHVNVIGLPPAESAEATRSYFGITNFFGGPTQTNSERLQVIERENEGAKFVILSDVHLDNVNVLDKLKMLFEGFSDSPPVLFIFMGNFLAEPHGAQSAVILRDQFIALADIICQNPSINEISQFVFIPGPSDPGFVNIFPRPPFADCIVQQFKQKVKRVEFATNPLRIKYCTKEILVFREDILTKMCRNALYFPCDVNTSKYLVQTLIGQANLCPMPMHVCPVYWSFGHALSLYPLPDVVIIGDKSDPFVIDNDREELNCTFINPGSFVKTEFSFKIYFPFSGEVEESNVPSI